ncbi:MAG: tRNA (cytidine(56)-2'-O)-methyltransferase [Candidatus Methanosuratincola sp.]|nr:tRNA (cytidine(56)-2'-O)-methyltransferase [Candidatus Methanosuratincola sp.]
MPRIAVLRLGHRPSRDKRITTHVCLVARAFGAEGVFISGVRDESIHSTIQKVMDAWGGDFWVEFVGSPMKVLDKWKASGGVVAHLTMYGIPVKQVKDMIPSDRDLLVIVGGEKVPAQYYEKADFNVAIGNQPHSEVAALAIFLDRMTGGAWEGMPFKNARLRIVPSERGKNVEQY